MHNIISLKEVRYLRRKMIIRWSVLYGQRVCVGCIVQVCQVNVHWSGIPTI